MVGAVAFTERGARRMKIPQFKRPGLAICIATIIAGCSGSGLVLPGNGPQVAGRMPKPRAMVMRVIIWACILSALASSLFAWRASAGGTDFEQHACSYDS